MDDPTKMNHPDDGNGNDERDGSSSNKRQRTATDQPTTTTTTGQDSTREEELEHQQQPQMTLEQAMAEIAKVRQENAKKDEIIAKKDEIIAKKDEIIAKKEEEMNLKDEKFKEEMNLKDEKFKEVDEKFKEADTMHSVEGVIEHPPRMDPNPACKPSIIDNEQAQAAVTKYRKANAQFKHDLKEYMIKNPSSTKDDKNRPTPPKRFDFHEPARIIRRDINIDLFDFNINTKGSNGLKVKSALSIERDFEGHPHLSHHNETSPQDAMSMVIKDVIRCRRAHGISVVKEATLFSLRPDLLAIRYGTVILFLGEIKNPSKDDDSAVFLSETAAGQSLDYDMVIFRCGMDFPFVILSTYNHSTIVTIEGKEKEYEKILDEASEKLKSGLMDDQGGSQTPQTPQTPSKGKKKLPPHSPDQDTKTKLPFISVDKKSPDLKTPLDNADDEEEEYFSDDDSAKSNTSESDYNYRGREVVYSQTFDNEMNYKLVTLVLASSLIAAKKSKGEGKALIPDNGVAYNEKLCTLTERGFSWEPVNIKSTNYTKAPKFDRMQNYYVFCQIGQGGSGKTVLCGSSTGKMFCVKLFLIPPSTRYTEKEREQEFDNHYEKKVEEADEEFNRWNALEPDYQSYYRRVTLNKLPAITMPYFQPIPFGLRNLCLEKLLIRKELEHAAIQGYYYSDDEMRWRHFGCRWSDDGLTIKITLLDLGSMEKVESGSIDHDRLDRQISELKRRSENEPQIVKKVVIA